MAWICCGCGGDTSANTTDPPPPPPPPAPAAGPTPEAVAAAKAYSASMGGQTFLVMFRGQVLDESYLNEGAPDRIQLLASATKGFTGMLGAIAAADGLFNLGSALSFVQTLPPGVYIAMNGRYFTADNVTKNRNVGVFEERLD